MQEHRQALEVVARSHQRHARRGPGLPDGAKALAAHLRDLRKRVFHPCPDLGNAPVAPLLAFAQGLVWPGFALDVLAIAQRTQHLAALITGIAPVSVHGPAGVVLIEHFIEVRAVMLAGGAGEDFADELVFDVGADAQLVAVVALAVFLAFMTAGRIFGTQMLDRYGRVVVLQALFGAAIVGSLLVVFGNVTLAFIGAAIWGVGASLAFPVGMSAAADDPQRAALRISVVSTVGYGAFLSGPPLLGFLGDHVGILHALLFVTATAVVAAIVAPAAKPLEGAKY